MMDNKAAFRTASRVHVSGRLRDLLLLVVAIIVGMLLSVNAQAQQPRHKVYKSKRACAILAQKRNQTDNIRVAARKPKYKPMAEMEAPAAYRISARKEEKDNKGIQR